MGYSNINLRSGSCPHKLVSRLLMSLMTSSSGKKLNPKISSPFLFYHSFILNPKTVNNVSSNSDSLLMPPPVALSPLSALLLSPPEFFGDKVHRQGVFDFMLKPPAAPSPNFAAAVFVLLSPYFFFSHKP